MTTITHDLRASCPPGRLWELLSVIEAVATYNPGISAARLRSAKSGGLGAERECDLVPKGKVVERVIHWEDGKAVGLEIVESDWPITFMRWVTRIHPEGSGARVTQKLEYEVKFGPLGALLDALVMRRSIDKAVAAALDGMIRRAEGTS
jgi:hypothetical protein